MEDAQGIIAKLQSCSSPVYKDMSLYLSAFDALSETKDPSQRREIQMLLRAEFLDFLKSSMAIIDEKLISLKVPMSEPNEDLQSTVKDLVLVFQLCLRCLEAVETADELYDGRFWVMNFIKNLCEWKLFDRAEVHGFKLLSGLRRVRGTNVGGIYMPPDIDLVLAKDVVTIVSSILTSVVGRQSKNASDYERVFSLVDELHNWFRYDRGDETFLPLVGSLQLLTKHLISELCNFNAQLVLSFYEMTITVSQSATQVNLQEFVRCVCFNLISMSHQTELDTLTILHFILKSQLLSEDFAKTSLLFDVIDMLALKGIVKFHEEIYSMMSSVYKGNEDREKLLSILWDSGRLNHSLCISLVCDELLKKLSNAFDKEVEYVCFWEKCFKSSISSLAFLPVQEVKSAAKELILPPWRSDSDFRAGYLLYDLGDKLFSTGNYFEALTCAADAFELRAKLFKSSFPEIYDLIEHGLVHCETWCSHVFTWDGKGFYVSPWKALQCFLESLLQFGCIKEAIGEGEEAACSFLMGKTISDKQDLPLFAAAFSSALGNLYMNKKSYTLSLNEFKHARRGLDMSVLKSCPKCCLMQQASVEMHLGHLHRNLYFSERRNASVRGSYIAELWYTSSLSKLKSEWSDSPKCLQEVEDGLKGIEEKIPFQEQSSPSHPVSSDATKGKKSCSEAKIETFHSTCGFCKRQWCWFCLSKLVGKSKSLLDCISFKRELLRRKLCLGILSGQGKYLERNNQIDGAKENIMEKISVLFGRSPSTQPYSFDLFTSLLDFVSGEFSEDSFAIERASFLYDICWFSLKNKKPSESRTTSCELFVELKDAVLFLKKAYVLSREVPALLQKVSKLLSVIYIVSPKMKLSLPSHSQELSESRWATYFHQASIGTNLMNKIINKYSKLTGSTSEGVDTCRLLSLSPECVGDLERLVTEFFSKIPCTTVMCISLVGGPFAALLGELLEYPPHVQAWMIISRLHDNRDPLAMLLPFDVIDKDHYGLVPEKGEMAEDYGWKHSVIEDVVPSFKFVMDDYESITGFERSLDNLLRKLEGWFGSWKYALLGEFSDSKNVDRAQEELMNQLSSKMRGVNKSNLRVILGVDGVKDEETSAFVSSLLLSETNCLVGEIEKSVEPLPDPTLQWIYDAASKLQATCQKREPVIMVLDSEIQMIPWEILPILRSQEVYRMPSLGSIFLALKANCENVDKDSPWPRIDPTDAYYVLNPDKTVVCMQKMFEGLFKNENLEGMAGLEPTAEELSRALEKHDLYIYGGHGAGLQYISRFKIELLSNCAAAVLDGCSSAALRLNGPYIATGAPISYLLGGAPFVLGHLWPVGQETYPYMETLFKSLFDSSSPGTGAEMGGFSKLASLFEVFLTGGESRSMGSLISQARDSCPEYSLKVSPVCYGVPTFICRW